MSYVPGLRSPYAKVGRIVYFGRMLDKIRLHAAGRLPADYVNNLGDTQPTVFDGRCCTFLGINYAELQARLLAGRESDEQLLAWAEAHGGKKRTDEECMIWSMFMVKRGWRDEGHGRLIERVAEAGPLLEGKTIETMFDYLEYDEGRDPMRSRPWEYRSPLAILLMGVAGSGKTTIGLKLAADLGWRFNDADDFHPPANIAKMSAGIPLNDEDRLPWLLTIRDHIDTCLRNGESAIVTCSALKERYRDTVVSDPARVKLVYLKGSRELLLERISGRQGHFMKPEMLDSQLAALEEPQDALVADIAQSPEDIAVSIRRSLGL